MRAIRKMESLSYICIALTIVVGVVAGALFAYDFYKGIWLGLFPTGVLVVVAICAWMHDQHANKVSPSEESLGRIEAKQEEQRTTSTKQSQQLDRITALLESKGKDYYSEALLKKYPFGYVIFEIDYKNLVTPYRSQMNLIIRLIGRASSCPSCRMDLGI